MATSGFAPSIHYQRQGKGETLVLLHGFASSGDFWQGLMPQLAANFDVVAIDWPGFGRSHEAPPCASLESFAELLLEGLGALGVRRFHVVGFSMSGFVVQQLLAHHADRLLSAVLYGAGAYLDKARRFEPMARTIERLRDEGPQATAARVLPHWFAREPSRAVMAACEAAARGMSTEAGVAAMQAMATADFRGKLAQALVPTLVITGDGDHTHPPRSALELWQELAQGQLAILPGCGHAAHLESPEPFAQTLTRFLLGVRS